MLIHAADWVSDLKENFNIVSRKSLILEPPHKLSFEHSLAYVVGYIDGDGCIGYRESGAGRPCLYLTIVGTCAMLEWIKTVLDKLVPALPGRTAVGVFQYRNIYRYTLQGIRAEMVVRALRNLDCPHLARKWDRLVNK